MPAGVRGGATLHPRLSADGCVAVAITEIPFDLFRDNDVWRLWVGLVAFGWFFYVNFAGYSDLAIGTGRLLGLAEMGRIKAALAAEAARDAAPTTVQSVATGVWRDSMTVTLPPLAGVELKLRMRAGAQAEYTWRAAEAPVFFHMHGEPPNAPRDAAPHRYGRGTAQGDSGTFTAAFDGVHGWFWRNRNDVPVSITLRTRGDYIELKEMP